MTVTRSMTTVIPRRPPARDIGTMRYVPVAISALVLAVHFLRGGTLLFVAIASATPLLLLTRRAGAVRAVQGALLAGAIMWLVTAIRIGEMRHAIGAPSTRMFLILGAVAVFTALSALPLRSVPPSVAKRQHLQV